MRPTNFDLVNVADAIVIASAMDEHPSSIGWSVVRFRVDGVLKGPAPRAFDAQETGLGTPPASDPNELEAPNPQSGEGGCIRRIFAKSRAYVVFLHRGEDGTWDELQYADTRANEDYFGKDSLWIRTIRDYLAVQKLPEGRVQHVALERLLRDRRADPSPAAQVEAADIRRALRALSVRGWRKWRFAPLF